VSRKFLSFLFISLAELIFIICKKKTEKSGGAAEP
jgi:hypothetical protein